jgi:hypothetical protein
MHRSHNPTQRVRYRSTTGVSHSEIAVPIPHIRSLLLRLATWPTSLSWLTRFESLNMSLRKIINMRGSFPTDEAAMKPLYLALQNASQPAMRVRKLEAKLFGMGNPPPKPSGIYRLPASATARCARSCRISAARSALRLALARAPSIAQSYGKPFNRPPTRANGFESSFE